MNYEMQYFRLIEKAKLPRVFTEITEKHHILPSSLGGGDEIENIVRLTAREHYLAHLLLSKIYIRRGEKANASKMATAIMWMSNRKNIKTGRQYKSIRENYIKFHPLKDEKNIIALKNGMQKDFIERGYFKILCACGCGENVGFARNAEKKKFKEWHKSDNYCKCGCGQIAKVKYAQGKMPFICGCGCGGLGETLHCYIKPINFLHGHNITNSETSSKSAKLYLSKLSPDEMKNRMRKSCGQADQNVRAANIRKGKASSLSAFYPDNTVKYFSSLECGETVGKTYTQIKYIIRNFDGVDRVTGIKYKYEMQYKGGNKWK